jgi:hypothetical protein
LLDAVHVHVLLVETLMLPVPAGASTLSLPGEIEYEQTSADWRHREGLTGDRQGSRS